VEEARSDGVLSRHPARKTKSGKGIYIQDNEIVYVASIKSVRALLNGEREEIFFAKFPYRKVIGEENIRDTTMVYCLKCGRITMWRRINEDKWRCEMCGSEKTARELIDVVRSILECD